MTVGELDTTTPLRHDMDVLIPLDDITLEGLLSAPEHARGVILFAYGSGSSRHNACNHFIAEQLYQRGFSTLLTDLLTPAEEEKMAEATLDADLLSRRLATIVKWVDNHGKIGNKPLGLFSASIGAASALAVAARLPHKVKAVVSHGGRPDLAGEELDNVQAPALLIVGSNDRNILKLNKNALARLSDTSRLEIVMGAARLLEGSEALKQVAGLTAGWFERHLEKEK